MAHIDLTFFWTSIALYGLSFFVFFYGLIATGGRGLKAAVSIVGGGLLLHTISLGLRWYFSGHMPGDNIYELNSVGGWFTVLFYLALQYYYPKTRVIGIFALAITLAMMLYGYAKPHGLGPLSDEYQSHWFYFHIISAFLAYSCYVIATSAAILFLARQYKLWRFADAEKIPSQDFLEDLNVRFVMYGFGGHAVMLASGSIWANTAWGSYWNWDPVETWSLITWLIYGFHLHAKTFLGWRGDRLAWTSIVALTAIVFTFWGVPHLPTKDLTH